MRSFHRQQPRLKSPHPGVWLTSVALACLAAIPIVLVLGRGLLTADPDMLPPWPVLRRIVAHTALLAVGTACMTGVIGTIQALLIEQAPLRWRQFWRIVAVLPLAMPPYVLAMCVASIGRPRGVLERWLVEYQLTEWGVLPFGVFYGLGGSIVLLGLCLSPYVFLPVSAALRQTSGHLDEQARLCGVPWHTRLVRVTIPLVLPSALGGMALVIIYALGEYGLPSLLRVSTLSTAIFSRYTGAIDQSGTALLSVPLICAALGLLHWAHVVGGQAPLHQGTTWRPAAVYRAHPSVNLLAHAVLVCIALCALVLPVVVLCYWMFQPVAFGVAGHIPWPAIGAGAIRTFLLVGGVALLTVLVGFAPAVLLRYAGKWGTVLARLAQAGSAMPGVVVALGVVYLVQEWAPALRGSIVPLVLAYIIRTVPQTIQSSAAAFMPIPAVYAEAARSMGASTIRVFWRILMPLASPGVQAGWALIALSMLKELPATLLLRPVGFDTLAVHIWMPASEGLYGSAAAPALVLLVAAVLPLNRILHHYLRHDRRGEE
ncbi:MAG: hypothetical protein RLY87_1821 [Chloroflexota bacterium]|jgi:iron(III) transport system permease protein